jgi:hypothetical protein
VVIRLAKDVLVLPIGTTIVVKTKVEKPSYYTRLDHNYWFLSEDPNVKITTITVVRFAQMGLVSILARLQSGSCDGV